MNTPFFKFFSLYLVCALALSFTACDRVKEDKLPEPQTTNTYKVREGKPVLIDLFKRHNLSTSATFELKGAPAKGTAQFVENGLLMYSPNSGISTTDEVQYTYCVNGNCQTQALQMEIVSQTTPQTDTTQNCVYAYTDVVTLVVPLSLSANITIPVLSNDFFCQGTSASSFQLSVLFTPKRGTALVQGSNIKYTYNSSSASTINPDYFVYRLSQNGVNYYGLVIVNLQFLGVPCPILAQNDKDTVAIGKSRFVDVLFNDTICADSLQSITIVTPPTQGTASLALSNKGINYISTATASGTDSFVYRLTRKNGTYSEATANILLYTAQACPTPQAQQRCIHDVFLVSKSQMVNNQVSLDVLANDKYCPADFAPGTMTAYVPPTQGTVQIASQQIVYTLPSATFSGRVRINYTFSGSGNFISLYADVIVID